MDSGCKTIANMIKGKDTEEIRRIFNIQNDFTPEEEEQIRLENEWAEGELFPHQVTRYSSGDSNFLFSPLGVKPLRLTGDRS